MNFHFHPEAAVEVETAALHYEEHGPGLRGDFLSELEFTINRIIERPWAWGRISPNERRCRMGRFPYGVVYRILDDEIEIVAVMHLHREPGYWAGRA